jgi:hypothetical protein
MFNFIAQIKSNPFGVIKPPVGTPDIGITDPQAGLIRMVNFGLNAVLIISGLYALLNLVLAGYAYITSAGDAKRVQEANQRITYTIVGLVIIVLTPLIAAVLGIVIFKDWTAILNPNFKTINDATTP